MVASLLHLLYTSCKASTHLVVLVFDISMGPLCLCSYFYLSLSVSLSGLFMCLFLAVHIIF